ncbi:MAG: hypothetical protein ACXW11_00630 [Methylotenera sp.]
MQVTTRRILSSASAELAQPDLGSKAKLAKKNGKFREQVSAEPDDTNKLTKINLARLLASCGDCV